MNLKLYLIEDLPEKIMAIPTTIALSLVKFFKIFGIPFIFILFSINPPLFPVLLLLLILRLTALIGSLLSLQMVLIGLLIPSIGQLGRKLSGIANFYIQNLSNIKNYLIMSSFSYITLPIMGIFLLILTPIDAFIRIIHKLISLGIEPANRSTNLFFWINTLISNGCCVIFYFMGFSIIFDFYLLWTSWITCLLCLGGILLLELGLICSFKYAKILLEDTAKSQEINRRYPQHSCSCLFAFYDFLVDFYVEFWMWALCLIYVVWMAINYVKINLQILIWKFLSKTKELAKWISKWYFHFC